MRICLRLFAASVPAFFCKHYINPASVLLMLFSICTLSGYGGNTHYYHLQCAVLPSDDAELARLMCVKCNLTYFLSTHSSMLSVYDDGEELIVSYDSLCSQYHRYHFDI